MKTRSRPVRGKRPLLLGGLVAVLIAAGWAVWQTATARPRLEPPAIPFEDSPPAVARAVRAARDAVLDAPHDADAWGRLGMVLFAHQFDPEPQLCFEQAARLDPTEFRWPYLHALCVEATDRERAVRLFDRAVNQRTDYAVAHNRLGELLLELGRYEEAEKALRTAQRLEPDQVRPHLALARWALLADRPDEARTWAERAVRLDARRRGSLELLAMVHRRCGNQAAAQRAWQAAQTLPEQPPSWQHDAVAGEVLRLRRDPDWQWKQAQALQSEGRLQEAIQLLEQAVAGDPRAVHVHCALARALLRAGRLADAANVLDRAARLHPGAAEVHFQRGVIHFLANEYPQAEQFFRQAVEIKPDYALAHYNLGHAVERRGDATAATAAFRQAIRYRPAYADAHKHLGRLLLQQDRAATAVDHLEQAARLAPSDRESRQLLERARRRAQDGTDGAARQAPGTDGRTLSDRSRPPYPRRKRTVVNVRFPAIRGDTVRRAPRGGNT